MRILTVCTGNICRSPLMAQVLQARVADLPAAAAGQITIESAGTHATPGQAMPEQAERSSASLGGDPGGHKASYLSEATLLRTNLVLTAERSHRARVVALAPALLRRTFTLREFARLSDSIDEADFLEAMDGPLVAENPEARLSAMLGVLADARGLAPQPSDANDDDVIDPYRRSEHTFKLAATQMTQGIDAAARLLSMPALWQA